MEKTSKQVKPETGHILAYTCMYDEYSHQFSS